MLLKGRNFKKGDLVIVQEKNIHLSHWPLHTVAEVYPGHDSVTYIVKLRTPTNETVRPANKLYLMEESNN